MANRYFEQFFYSFVKRLTSISGHANLVQAVKGTVVAQGMTYTAKDFGVDGITVTLVTGGTAGSEVVTVVGKAIEVQIETGVTTQTQLKAAIDGDTEAAALIAVSVASGSTTVAVAAAVALAGAVKGVSGFVAKGVSSIERTGAGEYTIILEDRYSALQIPGFQVQAATAVDLVPQVKSVDVVGDKKIVVQLLAGATPTEVAAAAVLYFDFRLRNSSVA